MTQISVRDDLVEEAMSLCRKGATLEQVAESAFKVYNQHRIGVNLQVAAFDAEQALIPEEERRRRRESLKDLTKFVGKLDFSLAEESMYGRR
jgi:hypothetical protein